MNRPAPAQALRALSALGFGASLGLLAWASARIVGGADGLPLVWLPAGALPAGLWLFGPLALPWLALGSVLGWWAAGLPLHVALPLVLGHAAVGWMAVAGLRRHAFDPQLSHGRDVLLLLGAVAIGAPALTAAHSTAWLVLAGQIESSAIDRVLRSLLVADALGGLLLAWPLLLWGRLPASAVQAGTRHPAVWALAATVLPLLLWLAMDAPALRMLMLAAAALALGQIAMSAGPPAALCCQLAWSIGALTLHALGRSPFSVPGLDVAVPLLQGWLALLPLAAMLPHAQATAWRRAADRGDRATGMAGLGLADWHLPTGTGHASALWQRLLEPLDRAAPVSLERWMRRVHPEDRPALAEVLAEPEHGHDGEPVAMRRQLRIWAHEQWRWFDLAIQVAERTPEGAPVRVVATVADAQASHRSDDRERLSASLFQHLHEGMLIADADMRVLDANPAYCRIVGQAREAVLGSVPPLLRTASSDPQTRAQQAALWAALRARGNWVGDVSDRRADGSACLLHMTVSSVHGPDGALRYHVIVVSDITEQREQRARLERQALFDELTRLPNRAHLGKLLADAMAAADRDGHLLAVCCADLDHFKAINERHGRAVADRLLQEAARRLQGALRSRGSFTDTAARLGGDEFVLLLRAATVDEARAAAERVLRVLTLPYEVLPGSAELSIGASVGATLYPIDSSDADTLLRHADHALFGAKQAGRNGVMFFDAEHLRRNEERTMAIGRVQDALDRGQLVPYYQPKVDLRRGTVVGVEALLRWIHPEHGVVAPAQFLPMVEHTGVSVRIGDHMLARALDQIDQWLAQGLELSVSVNVSARHLQEPDFAQRLAELLARHSRPLGHRLELEILESAALADIEHTSAVLQRCAALGVRASLDDFGTGYSTLTYLKRLPLQGLKIDRSFVQGMLADPQDRAIVEGVVSLARTFDCQVVAEGVETPAQARALLDLGCGIGQGNGIAQPMPPEALPEWVAGWRGLFALTAAPVARTGEAGAA